MRTLANGELNVSKNTVQYTVSSNDLVSRGLHNRLNRKVKCDALSFTSMWLIPCIWQVLCVYRRFDKIPKIRKTSLSEYWLKSRDWVPSLITIDTIALKFCECSFSVLLWFAFAVSNIKAAKQRIRDLKLKFKLSILYLIKWV